MSQFKQFVARAYRRKTEPEMPPDEQAHEAIALALDQAIDDRAANPTTEIADFHQEMVSGRLRILTMQDEQLSDHIARLTEERRQTRLAISAFTAAQSVLNNDGYVKQELRVHVDTAPMEQHIADAKEQIQTVSCGEGKAPGKPRK